MKIWFYFGFIAVAIPSMSLVSKSAQPAATGTTISQVNEDNEADIQASLAKLSKEDRQVAEAQMFCPIMTTNRLGVMGTPIKVMIKDQPVFLCCKGCRSKALANPDKTLAAVAKLKSKRSRFDVQMNYL